MTTNNSSTLIYNYHDKATADILNKWAEKYAKENNVSYDYAMVVTLLEVHNKGAKRI